MTKYLTLSEIRSKTGKGYDIDLITEHFKNEGRLDRQCITDILRNASQLLASESNLIEIEAPCVIFGDLHGQFYDFVNILCDYPQPSDTHMLFLGDYVDRGYFGCENVFLLMAMKVTYPDKIHLLRGNHECRLMTAYFNFKQEVLHKYSESVYNEIMKTFDCLPICALLKSELGKFFCVHGGISPNLNTLSDINKFNRFREPPSAGLFCDLLWADPLDESVYFRLSEKQKQEWQKISFTDNKVRGCSYSYGFQGVDDFLKRNDITSIIRAHEVQKEGCNLHYFNRDDITHPLVMTLFSAPNYCDVYDNDGAVLVLLDNELSFLSYNAVAHPFYLPKFQDGLNFSLPHLSDQLNDIANKLYAFTMYSDFVDEDDDKPIKFYIETEKKEEIEVVEVVEEKKSSHRRDRGTKKRPSNLGLKLPIQNTTEAPKRKGPSVEDFLQPLDLNPSEEQSENEKKEQNSFRNAASRSRSFVNRLPSCVTPRDRQPKFRPRCSTFSMKGKFDESFDRFSFTVVASKRFAHAKEKDLENERRPPPIEELVKQWESEYEEKKEEEKKNDENDKMDC